MRSFKIEEGVVGLSVLCSFSIHDGVYSSVTGFSVRRLHYLHLIYSCVKGSLLVSLLSDLPKHVEPIRRVIDVIELLAPLLGGLVHGPQSPVQVIDQDELLDVAQEIGRLRVQPGIVVAPVVAGLRDVGFHALQPLGRPHVLHAEALLSVGVREARVIGVAVFFRAGAPCVFVEMIGNVECSLMNKEGNQ